MSADTPLCSRVNKMGSIKDVGCSQSTNCDMTLGDRNIKGCIGDKWGKEGIGGKGGIGTKGSIGGKIDTAEIESILSAPLRSKIKS